jgi:FKBP-type peptidyl-prolyl cis-trans isomerase
MLTIFIFNKKTGKSPSKIDIGSDLSSGFILELIEKKQIKKPQDVLFLVEALNAWDSKRQQLKEEKYAETKYSAAELEAFEFEMQESGLGIHVLEKGNGPLPEKGKPVAVHYRGYLLNGKIFDESYKRGSAFSFPLGMGRVIKGWDEGIAKLPAGSHALLKVPADLGYGARGSGPIPPNSTLIFDVFVKGN